MTGCPSCGSDRLKAAPLLLADPLLSVLLRRRRYRCAVCDWVGRRHRLRRRAEPDVRRSSRFVSVLFALFTVLIVVVGGGLLVENCKTPSSEGAGVP